MAQAPVPDATATLGAATGVVEDVDAIARAAVQHGGRVTPPVCVIEGVGAVVLLEGTGGTPSERCATCSADERTAAPAANRPLGPLTAPRGGGVPVVASPNAPRRRAQRMNKKFERHRQPWTDTEISTLHHLVGKGMSLQAIARALTRSEESVQTRAKLDKLKITKMR